MVKRKSEHTDDETRDEIERMENEGAPASNEEPLAVSGEDGDCIVIYRGKHPHIRRHGIVLKPDTPKRVSAVIAALLGASHDIEVRPADDVAE